MSLYKIISQVIKIINFLDIGRPDGFVGIQWVDSLSTYLFPCIGGSDMDDDYEKVLNKKLEQHGCVKHKKGKKTYDYREFFTKHWDKVAEQKYFLLRLAHIFLENGKKDLALLIREKLISCEKSEEIKAIMIVLKLYCLTSTEAKQYLEQLLNDPQFAFVKAQKKAWGLALLYLAAISFKQKEYKRADEVLGEIINDEYYKKHPIIYLYAKQLLGDILYMQERYEEARVLYDRVLDEMFLDIAKNYVTGDVSTLTLEKILRDSVVAGGTGYSMMKQFGEEQRYQVTRLLMGEDVNETGLGDEESSDVNKCYMATRKDIMLRYYVALFFSITYRNQSIRVVRADKISDISLVLAEIRGAAERCVAITKGSWAPFSQEYQAEHAFLIAEQLLRLNDILSAKNNYEEILKLNPRHLHAMVRLAELRFLKPLKKSELAQAQSVMEDINFFKNCLHQARQSRAFSIAFNYFIFKASLTIIGQGSIVSSNKIIRQIYTDYIGSLTNISALMRGTPLEFYWSYISIISKYHDLNNASISDLRKVVSVFKEFTEADSTERYLLREIFKTDNLTIVNAKLREIRDRLNLIIEGKIKEEDEKTHREEKDKRQKKLFDNIEEAVTVFFAGTTLPSDEEILTGFKIEPAKRAAFMELIEKLITTNKESAELVLLAFEDNSMINQEVSVEIPYGILRGNGFVKVRFRKCENDKVSFVLFKEDGDFVQAEIPSSNMLNALNNASLFHRIMYLVLLNTFSVSQDQIQIVSFGDIKLISENEELKSFNTPLTSTKIVIINIFMYANPLVQLIFNRIMTSGLCDDECIRRLKEQIDVQRHLLMFKKSNYKPRVDDTGNLIINLDDFKDSPLRRFFEAVHARLIDGKILFKFVLSGNIEIEGEFTKDGIMIIYLPDKGKAKLEYSIILELENFMLHLLNAAIFEDIRKIAESGLTQPAKEKQYAKISTLIGYPMSMKEAFGAIYTKYPIDKRRWVFNDISSIANPFMLADLFVLVGETPQGIKIFKPVTIMSTLGADDKLFQPRFIFASKSLQRKNPVDSKMVYEYVLNIMVSTERYKYGFRKKWRDASKVEQTAVLDYIEKVQKGTISDPLLEIDATHALGVSFGWRYLRVQSEGIGPSQGAKEYYTYVPPYVKFMELQGKVRQNVIAQLTAVKSP